MKSTTKKLFFAVTLLAALVVVLYLSLYVYLNEYGQKILLQILQKHGIDAKVSSVNFSFPARITIVNFQSPRVSFLKGIFEFGPPRLVKPAFFLRTVYLQDAHLAIANVRKAQGPQSPAGPVSDEVSSPPRKMKTAFVPPFIIKNLTLENASVVYRDESYPEPLSVSLYDIKAVISNADVPRFPRCTLDLTASLKVNDSLAPDAVLISGWIDWLNKDMDATVKIRKIDYFVFTPYYPPVWQPDRYDVKEAVLSLDSYFTSEDDALSIDYYIIVDKAVFKEEPQNPGRAKSVQTILALFKKGEVSVVHMPPVETTMSSPEFKMGSFEDALLWQIKSIYSVSFPDKVNKAFEDFFTKTQGKVGGGVENIKSITVDPTVEAFKSFGEEFMKSFRKIMDKNKEEAPQDTPID